MPSSLLLSLFVPPLPPKEDDALLLALKQSDGDDVLLPLAAVVELVHKLPERTRD
jgi:hypothetical protein